MPAGRLRSLRRSGTSPPPAARRGQAAASSAARLQGINAIDRLDLDERRVSASVRAITRINPAVVSRPRASKKDRSSGESSRCTVSTLISPPKDAPPRAPARPSGRARRWRRPRWPRRQARCSDENAKNRASRRACHAAQGVGRRPTEGFPVIGDGAKAVLIRRPARVRLPPRSRRSGCVPSVALPRQPEIMRDKHQRRTLAVLQPEQQIDDRGNRCFRQDCRSVHPQRGLPVRVRARGQGDALLLATGSCEG